MTRNIKSPDELEAVLSDPAEVTKIFANKDSRKEFMDSYVLNFLSKDDAYAKQLDEQIQNGMAKFLKDNGASQSPVPLTASTQSAKAAKAVSRGKGVLYNKTAPGAALDAQPEEDRFETMAEYIQAVWPKSKTLRNGKQLAHKLDKLDSIQNSFGSEVPADGGFLVPETLRSDLLQWALEHAVVRSRATVIPMSTLRVPIPLIDSTSNVNSVFGGVVGYWTEEAASLTESQAAFGRAVLEARKLTAYAAIPNELLADAVAFGSFFDQIFPQAIAYFEDVAFLSGSGSGEPTGVINSDGAVTVAAEVGQTTKTVLYQNVVNMYSRMLPTALDGAVWLCSPDVLPQLFQMSLAVGTGGSTVMVGNYPGQTAADQPKMSLLGHPLIVTEKIGPIGTAGCLSFINFDYYLIGDRQVMQTSSSTDYLFQNDKTAFRVIERVDGQPWLHTPITPHNNSSNTLSPYVQLAGI
jgi:HK97 family phage major capsid protein